MNALNVSKLIEGYLSREEWRASENANIPFSMAGLVNYCSSSVTARYVLRKIYPPRIARAHLKGEIHIHDLGFGMVPYCAGWSLRQLLSEGFNEKNRICSKPPRHFHVALMQMVNFIGSLQNEWAGAQAFNSIDTLLAPYIRADRLDFREIKQGVQEFVYNLNVTSRWGGQSPFTNVALDLTIPDDLKDQVAMIRGEEIEPYGELEREANLFQKAFLEVLREGDASSKPFTFPIPTFGITRDFEWDNEVSFLLFQVTSKYGLPYFENFINSDLRPSDVRSMCCHLRLSLKELKRNVTGGLFGSGDSTGSLGVVTVNLPRIGYLSEDETGFFDSLSRLMELAKDSLEAKRSIVESFIRKGLLPFTERYLGSLRNHFGTIGIVGMHEALLNLGFDEGIVSDEGRDFALKVLSFMKDRIEEFQERTGNLYNLEATPAEGASYRLARLDKKAFVDIESSGIRTPFYTNSTCLPVSSDLNLWEAIRHQEPLQCLYTGGTVFHIYAGMGFVREGKLKIDMSDLLVSDCKNAIRKIVLGSRLPYLTFTPTYSICPNDGYLTGEHSFCPECRAECDVYSRIVGYFRSVKNWNEGKKEEFRLRKPMSLNGSCGSTSAKGNSL